MAHTGHTTPGGGWDDITRRDSDATEFIDAADRLVADNIVDNIDEILTAQSATHDDTTPSVSTHTQDPADNANTPTEAARTHHTSGTAADDDDLDDWGIDTASTSFDPEFEAALAAEIGDIDTIADLQGHASAHQDDSESTSDNDDDWFVDDPAAHVTFGDTNDHYGSVHVTDDGVDLSLDWQDHASDHRDEEPTAADIASLTALDKQLDTRWGETTIEPTLTRITQLMDLLGNPQDSFRSIHVAGTNGKTSTVRMVESLLRAFSRRTGRTTSPHLQSPTERIAIDGNPIHPRDYVRIWEDIAPYVEIVDQKSTAAGGPRMSKFEVLTALAYAAFADAPVDVAAVEVGMGGSWDATNVIDSDIAVIMPVGLDHTDYLGDTIEKIAAEKAGIITRRRTDETNYTESKDKVVIVGRQEPEALRVILERAADTDNTVARYGHEFTVESSVVAVGGQQVTIRGLGGVYEDIFLPLSGAHQAHNAACALAAVEAFFGAGPGRQLDIDTVKEGFATVTSPGRLERVHANPTVFVDASHNPHGAAALGAALDRDFHFTRLVGVLAVLGDKDAAGILSALEPYIDEVICSTNNSPRALSAPELADLARDIFGEDRVRMEENLTTAVAVAIDIARDYNADTNPDTDDPSAGAGVIVTGSVVTAGYVRAHYGLPPA